MTWRAPGGRTWGPVIGCLYEAGVPFYALQSWWQRIDSDALHKARPTWAYREAKRLAISLHLPKDIVSHLELRENEMRDRDYLAQTAQQER